MLLLWSHFFSWSHFFDSFFGSGHWLYLHVTRYKLTCSGNILVTLFPPGCLHGQRYGFHCWITATGNISRLTLLQDLVQACFHQGRGPVSLLHFWEAIYWAPFLSPGMFATVPLTSSDDTLYSMHCKARGLVSFCSIFGNQPLALSVTYALLPSTPATCVYSII